MANRDRTRGDGNRNQGAEPGRQEQPGSPDENSSAGRAEGGGVEFLGTEQERENRKGEQPLARQEPAEGLRGGQSQLQERHQARSGPVHPAGGDARDPSPTRGGAGRDKHAARELERVGGRSSER